MFRKGHRKIKAQDVVMEGESVTSGVHLQVTISALEGGGVGAAA
jgi:hypothetical protein